MPLRRQSSVEQFPRLRSDFSNLFLKKDPFVLWMSIGRAAISLTQFQTGFACLTLWWVPLVFCRACHTKPHQLDRAPGASKK